MTGHPGESAARSSLTAAGRDGLVGELYALNTLAGLGGVLEVRYSREL